MDTPSHSGSPEHESRPDSSFRLAADGSAFSLAPLIQESRPESSFEHPVDACASLRALKIMDTPSHSGSPEQESRPESSFEQLVGVYAEQAKVAQRDSLMHAPGVLNMCNIPDPKDYTQHFNAIRTPS